MSQVLNNYKQVGSLLNFLWQYHKVLELKPFGIRNKKICNTFKAYLDLWRSVIRYILCKATDCMF
jgi:hypothetical protein